MNNNKMTGAMSKALGEILEGEPAVRQIGEFRRRQHQLFRHGERLLPDLLAHLAAGVFERHAGFHADQHQVEHVREPAP